MRNLYTPVFLACLLFPACFFSLDIQNDWLIFWFFKIAAAAALACLYFKKYPAAYALLVISMGLLAGGRFVEQKSYFNTTIERISVIPSDRYVSLKGRLRSFPELHAGHTILLLEIDQVRWAQQGMDLHFNVRLKINGRIDFLNRGDVVAIDAMVYKRAFRHNFFPNPVENIQLAKHIHANGFCKSVHLIEVTRKTSGLWRVTGKWRNKIRRAVERKYYSKGKPPDRRGVLLNALLTGERAGMTNQDKEQLTGSGVYHLLAISGAHIGIIALCCLTILKGLNITLKKRYIITAIILIVFLLLSGFRVSAERAVLMAILLFFAHIYRLETNIYNIISFCGILLLARNPAAFLDAGFVLTFSLTAIIAAGRHIVLPLLKQTGWRIFEYQRSFIAELISANLSASLAALPLSLYYFKRYSFSGIIAGVLLVPLTASIIGLGFIVILLAPLSGSLCQWVLSVLDIPLRLFFLITAFFSESINLNIYNASPPELLVILIPCLFCVIPRCRATFHKMLLIFFIVLLSVGISVHIFPFSPASLTVFFLDVGQGDAQIVVFPGGDGLLIDGGGVYYSDFQVGRHVLLPFILQKRIRIRWIAVSHYHADHSRGIAEIISILKPEALWLSSITPADRMYRGLLKKTPRSTQIRYIAAPSVIRVGNCRVQWLNPAEILHAARSKNNHSQVIKISSPYHSILFTGDIEMESEKQLADLFCNDIQADVLKVPHHGSATSSSAALLNCVSPRLAIFSCARYNRFGFPHRSVFDRYKRAGISCLSTAWRGGIQLVSLPGEIKVRCSERSVVFSF